MMQPSRLQFQRQHPSLRMLSHLVLTLAISASSLFAAHGNPKSQFVPLPVLQAKTIAVAVYWPNGTPSVKGEVQAEGEQFIRQWNRYLVVAVDAKPDLVALVTVSPVRQGAGFWRMLAYSLAVGASQFAASQQNYEHCRSEITGFGSGNFRTYNMDSSCYGYAPQAARELPPPPGPRSVLSGSILLFDGGFLKTNGPIPEPLLFAQANNHGSEPLISAAKRLQKEIDDSTKLLAARMAVVNSLAARIHVLAAGQNLTANEEQACDMSISQQIGSNPQMRSRLEQGKFDDTDRLFSALCVKPAAPK